LGLIPLLRLDPADGQKRKYQAGKHIVHDYQGSGCYGDPDGAGARLIAVHSDGTSDQKQRQTVNEDQHRMTK
jgi:hypothetical protein